MPAQDEFVIEILRDVGLVSHEQILQAKESAETNKSGVVDALIDSGVVTERDVTKALANQFGLEMISLADYRVPDEVIACMPQIGRAHV